MGVRGNNVVVLGVEKKASAKLQDMRTVRKIVKLDDHVCVAFAGLRADARVLIDKARVECQSYQLSIEVPVTIPYIARYIAGVQQKYTQRGGMRPFGISTLVVGFDLDTNTPHLYKTDPSGAYSAWKAAATGRSSKSVREYLEKHYDQDADDEETIKLAVKALLEVVDSGKNIDICVVRPGDISFMDPDSISTLVDEIEAAQEQDE